MAAGTNPVVVRPGWISTQFAGGESISSTGLAVLDEDTLAVFSNVGDIIVVNSKDGAVNRRIEGLSDPFRPGTMLKKEGSLLFAISPRDSSFVMGVYDLSANAWKGSVFSPIPVSWGQDPPVGVYRDEIRVILRNCQILRWKSADLSPLPTLQFTPSIESFGSGSITPIGTEIDGAYCVGITANTDGLIFESEGQWSVKRLPGYSAFFKGAPYSDQFLVIYANNANVGGALIWNKTRPGTPPEFVAHYYVNQLWNQKYSLTIIVDPDDPASKVLTILDLESPHDPPIIIPIDTSFLDGSGFPFMGITKDYFWITQRPQSGFYSHPLKFSEAQKLPKPLGKLITELPETKDSAPWVIKLSDQVDFPISVKVKGLNSDIVYSAKPRIIMPNSNEFELPIKVVNDSIPEGEETLIFELELSGNGFTEKYQMEVKIPENDFTHIRRSELEKLSNVRSMAVHPSGLVTGDDRMAYAADYHYQIGYEGERRSGFGRAVAIDSDYLAVGSVLIQSDPKKSGKDGDVAIYLRKTGKLWRKISLAKGRSEAFGAVLEIVDKRLFVGAPGISVPGSVSVLELGATGEPLVFRQPEPTINKNGFGTSIAVKGKSLWIGAPGAGKGMVFRFSLDTGELLETIVPPGGGYENFGTSLQVLSDSIAIGAPGDKGHSAVFLFGLKKGKLLQKIDSPFEEGGYFGASLALLEKKILVVGCPSSKFSPNGGLLIYRATKSGYRFLNMILPPKPIYPFEYPILTDLGSIGGISAEGSLLAILSGHKRNPIDVLSLKNLPGSYDFALISVHSGKRKINPVKAAKFAGASLDPWERTLGIGGSADDCQIAIEPGPTGNRLRLPNIRSIESGAHLVLEKSVNLVDWTPIASIEDGGANGWRALGKNIAIGGEHPMLEIPNDADSAFYRIRCHAP